MSRRLPPRRRSAPRTTQRWMNKRKAQESARPVSTVGGGQGGIMTPSGNAGSAWG